MQMDPITVDLLCKLCCKKRSFSLTLNVNSLSATKTVYCINLLPDHKILDWSKLKQIADDILKCT